MANKRKTFSKKKEAFKCCIYNPLRNMPSKYHSVWKTLRARTIFYRLNATIIFFAAGSSISQFAPQFICLFNSVQLLEGHFIYEHRNRLDNIKTEIYLQFLPHWCNVQCACASTHIGDFLIYEGKTADSLYHWFILIPFSSEKK